MKVIRYKPQPPKIPAWAQEALMNIVARYQRHDIIDNGRIRNVLSRPT
jgi:hypothetical protein